MKNIIWNKIEYIKREMLRCPSNMVDFYIVLLEKHMEWYERVR